MEFWQVLTILVMAAFVAGAAQYLVLRLYHERYVLPALSLLRMQTPERTLPAEADSGRPEWVAPVYGRKTTKDVDNAELEALQNRLRSTF